MASRCPQAWCSAPTQIENDPREQTESARSCPRIGLAVWVRRSNAGSSAAGETIDGGFERREIGASWIERAFARPDE